MTHLRLVHSAEDIERTFTPWTEDRYRLARLWDWLVVNKETPGSVREFLESPIVWLDAYLAMCEFEGEIA